MKRLCSLFLLAALCVPAIGQNQPETNLPRPAAPPAQPTTDKTTTSTPQAEQPAADQFAFVELKTTMGSIVLELNKAKAPISTENFVKYVEKGHYNGTIFHRVMKTFMIQGGGYDKEGKEKATDAPIKNEWKNGLKNVRGSVSMARTSQHDSATSQFFINTVDNAMLDVPRDGAAYAVFGRVVSGMDVVDKIADGKVKPRGREMSDPLEPVVIESARTLTSEQAAQYTSGAAPAPAAPANPKPEPETPKKEDKPAEPAQPKSN